MSNVPNCKVRTFWNELRVKNNFKLQDVADYLETDKGTTSRYLTGKQKMPPYVIRKLSDFFDIPFETAVKETERLENIYFDGGGRKRKVQVSSNNLKEETKEVKNYISYNNDKDVEYCFLYVIDALANWSDDFLTANADEQIKTLKAHKEALKFYIGKQKPDSQECLNAQHLILKIDILINKIKNAVKKIEKGQEKDDMPMPDYSKSILDPENNEYRKLENNQKKAKCTIEYSEPESVTMDIIEKDASSDDIAELILNTVYGNVTREEYEKIKNYLRG